MTKKNYFLKHLEQKIEEKRDRYGVGEIWDDVYDVYYDAADNNPVARPKLNLIARIISALHKVHE
jgi:hypothetical protein